MNTLADMAVTAAPVNGEIIVRLAGGARIRFPVVDNPRLARGACPQLNRIELSPFGSPWPELDEDLSCHGRLAGDYGQFQRELQA